MVRGQIPFVAVSRTNTVNPFGQQEFAAVGGSNVQSKPQSTVLFVGQLKMAAFVFTTVTICVQVMLLVQQSVAVHVRVMYCGQTPFVTVTNASVMFVPQQSSETAGGSKL